MKLILGSASPRRRELLAQIGIIPDLVLSTEIDETPYPAEVPRIYVERMAREKSTAVPQSGNALVLTADTTVSAGRRILGKPGDTDEAERFLRTLSGRRHQVTTAVCVRQNDKQEMRVVVTRVKFKRLSEAEVSAYLASGEWLGKAGGYAIQGIAAAFIPEIRGSYSNVVGLPLAETANLLTGLGYAVTYARQPT
jgi:septum formation protein